MIKSLSRAKKIVNVTIFSLVSVFFALNQIADVQIAVKFSLLLSIVHLKKYKKDTKKNNFDNDRG